MDWWHFTDAQEQKFRQECGLRNIQCFKVLSVWIRCSVALPITTATLAANQGFWLMDVTDSCYVLLCGINAVKPLVGSWKDRWKSRRDRRTKAAKSGVWCPEVREIPPKSPQSQSNDLSVMESVRFYRLFEQSGGRVGWVWKTSVLVTAGRADSQL